MTTIFENDFIKVSTTGRDDGFIAIIDNKTDGQICVHYDEPGYNDNYDAILIAPNDRIGLLADDEGRNWVKAIENNQIYIADIQKACKLEAENKYLLKLIESEHFSYQTTTGKKYSVFNTVRKQFAEELKKRSYCDNVFKDGKWHRYVFVDEIDELLKEYDK